MNDCLAPDSGTSSADGETRQPLLSGQLLCRSAELAIGPAASRPSTGGRILGGMGSTLIETSQVSMRHGADVRLTPAKNQDATGLLDRDPVASIGYP